MVSLSCFKQPMYSVSLWFSVSSHHSLLYQDRPVVAAPERHMSRRAADPKSKVQGNLQKIGEVFCARACTGVIPDITWKRNLFAALSPVQQHCTTGNRPAPCKHREIGCLLTDFHRMLKVACNIYCERNHLRMQQKCWMSSVSTHSRGPLRVWLVNYRPPWNRQASAEKKKKYF